MNSGDLNELEIGPGLKLTFALLIVLILGGNGLLLWQFHLARLQTERLRDVSQELIGVLRLQIGLLSVHQRLDQLVHTTDAGGLATESELMRRTLLDEIEVEMNALTRLPYETHVEPKFQPSLQTIEVNLPTQLEAINGLAKSGDWKAIRLRLDNELKPTESLCAALVAGIDQEVRGELALVVVDMRRAQLRIFVIVQVTGISTFLVAALLGGVVARRIITVRVHERVAERTRIARELHDNLLQSFHGLLFRIQAARNMLPQRSEEAMEALDGVIESAEQAIAEGRNAIQDLRAEPVAHEDLEHLLTSTCQELASSPSGDLESPKYSVTVEGAQRTLPPALQDEVYRIAREVLRNAFTHADARHIEVEIRYDGRMFRLRIRDDGKGIDPKVLGQGSRPGHWGLSGVRERAQLIGARLEIWSEAARGTEVELTIRSSAVNGPFEQRRKFGIFPKAKKP